MEKENAAAELEIADGFTAMRYRELNRVDSEGESGGHFCLFAMHNREEGCFSPLWEQGELGGPMFIPCAKGQCPYYKDISCDPTEFVKWMNHLASLDDIDSVEAMLFFVRGAVKILAKEAQKKQT